jgi:hypothetical protein
VDHPFPKKSNSPVARSATPEYTVEDVLGLPVLIDGRRDTRYRRCSDLRCSPFLTPPRVQRFRRASLVAKAAMRQNKNVARLERNASIMRVADPQKTAASLGIGSKTIERDPIRIERRGLAVLPMARAPTLKRSSRNLMSSGRASKRKV